MKFYVVGSVLCNGNKRRSDAEPDRPDITAAAEMIGKAMAEEPGGCLIMTALQSGSIERCVANGIIESLHRSKNNRKRTRGFRIIVNIEPEHLDHYTEFHNDVVRRLGDRVDISKHQDSSSFVANCIWAFEQCDVVIMLGGERNSIHLGLSAPRLRDAKPVLPVPCFEGAAREIWSDIHKNGNGYYGRGFDGKRFESLLDCTFSDPSHANELVNLAREAKERWRRPRNDSSWWRLATTIFCGGAWLGSVIGPSFSTNEVVGIGWLIACAAFAGSLGAAMRNWWMLRDDETLSDWKYIAEIVSGAGIGLAWMLMYLQSHLAVTGAIGTRDGIKADYHLRLVIAISLVSLMSGWVIDEAFRRLESTWQKAPHPPNLPRNPGG